MRHRLSDAAVLDIEHILDEMRRDFGTKQVQVYSDLIEQAIAMVAEDPVRPSSKTRPDLGPNVMSFRVAIASGRRGGASHAIYFTVVDLPARGRELLVIRVLHDRMEPRLNHVMGLDGRDEPTVRQEPPTPPDEDDNPFSP